MSEGGTKTMYMRPSSAAPLAIILRPSVRALPETMRLGADKGLAVFGSGSKCDLVLDDSTVSRQHASFELVPEGVVVRDLGSHNGTFYRGQRLQQMTLSPGEEVQLGGTRIRIELDRDTLFGGDSLRGDYFRGMIGCSDRMHRLFTTLGRLDGSLIPVLVTGESGVGKELVARAIHEGSRVSDGPFVALNCGALPKELVASALFGHKKGAFTGAESARRGAFLAADGGTLFLDEIGELPLDVQPMLLRALEQGEVVPVGEDRAQQTTARVVGATNRSLEAEVAAGNFREDLYFRLAVAKLEVPSLRERADDIPLLADNFARQEGLGSLPSDVLVDLASRTFRGNVRELRNMVRSYAVFGALPQASAPAPQRAAALDHLVDYDRPYLEQRDALVDQFSRVYFAELLRRTGGNQSEASRVAGLDRTYLGRLLSKLGIGRG